jgi:hypothetical protein
MTDNNEEILTGGNINIFDGSEFVFTQNAGGEVVGGGYKINSFFLQGGMAPMTTLNTPMEQNGGKVSSPFETLAVPAGLFYVNTRVPKKHSENDSEYNYKPHQTISDDMIDKLYALVEVDKKRKRKTRKHHTKLDKTKTRRLK